jgi:hypothetical protein
MAFQVVEARDDRAVATFVEVVLEEGRRGIAADAEVLRAHAADRNTVDKGVGTVTRDARSERNQVLHVVEVDIPDEIARHGRNGEWHILDAFLALGGRNRNFFDFLGRSGAGNRRQDCRRN